MRFDAPWALLLLLAIPLIILLRRRSVERRGAIAFPAAQEAALCGATWRWRLASLPAWLELLALILLPFAIARPQYGAEKVLDVSRGVAMEMVLDRSGSMGAPMQWGGRRVTKLDAVKHVFNNFVYGDGKNLSGRPADLIGLISFARYAETLCPLTLGHDVMRYFLDDLQLVQQREEDGTAIGDALALGAARLKTAGEAVAKQQEEASGSYDIKSKAIILITDGQNNTGKRTPMEAAELAASWGIKVYTIGIGSTGLESMPGDIFGMFAQQMSPPLLDEETLKSIAEKTGGAYFRADTLEALQQVYQRIDALEKTGVASFRYLDYRESFAPLAIAILGLLAASTVLRHTWLRVLP